MQCFPSGQVDFQGEIFWPYLEGYGGMLPRKILKILLLRLARIAFMASFPPIFFIKSLFFKNFRNNSKFREKFNTIGNGASGANYHFSTTFVARQRSRSKLVISLFTLSPTICYLLVYTIWSL